MAKVGPIFGRNEMDTHADTCILECNSIQIGDTGSRCLVSPFVSSYNDFQGIEIVSRATAIQHPITGETIILIINQGLWFGDNQEMRHSLINPNQIWAFGHHVQDNPYNDQPMAIHIDEENVSPLQSSGTTIFFDSYKPTEVELQTRTKIHLTSMHDWNPSKLKFPRVTHNLASIHTITHRHTTCSINATLWSISSVLDNDEYRCTIVSDIQVLSDVPVRWTFVSNCRHSVVSPQDISEQWQIGLTEIEAAT